MYLCTNVRTYGNILSYPGSVGPMGARNSEFA